MLSSGEYKILRLIKLLVFQTKKTIIMDEPELSLSVYWQKLLLDDILSYGEDLTAILATQSTSLINKDKEKYIVEVVWN